ncbi:MAG: IS3 family transposase [Chloroflexi bacterium]|nr:IS3 family transposase [Chloroflexota bacterium]
MQQNGMFPLSLVKRKPYKKSLSDGRFLDNLINGDFNPKKPNEVWAGDITYIKTVLGWVYLAVVVDLFNREIVGYAVSKSADAELVKRALGNALARSGKRAKTVFHSDRGTQYSSRSYQKMLSDHCLTGSMSNVSCPQDNACVESFFSTAKKECIYRKEYVTMDEVQHDLFAYIELFYNRKRMHGSLGYLSPVEYRLAHAA